jgi:hypothetical protein
MNRSVVLTAGFVASALSITLFAAEAQQKKAEPPKAAPAKAAEIPKAAAKTGAKITITGCANVGMPPTCTIIKGGDGANYEVTTARPVLPLDGTEVRLTGTVTDNLSICMQGRVLKDIEWSKTGKKCK